MHLNRFVVRCAVALALLFGLVAYAPDAKAVGEDKAGPLMGNFKLGPAVSFGNNFGFTGCGRFGCGFNATQFAMELEIAYAVDHKQAAYIGFNPQFEFGWGTIINLTATFQYDIQIVPNKVKGLYIYPKINAGVAIYPNTFGYRICGFGTCGSGAAAAFALQPEVGVKFNIWKNFHVLGEPLSFPIYIGDFTFAQWRFWLGCGVDV
jgi:hypothetical protein